MSIQRADDESKAFFRSVVPDDPRVEVRPMFANLAAFVNGNMFMGVYGRAIVLRLPAEDRETLVASGAAGRLEPVEGRALREYVQLPEKWRREPEKLRRWIDRALDFAAALPPKPGKRPRRRRVHHPADGE